MPRPPFSDVQNTPVVTALPSAPSDGMEVDLVADDAAAYGGPYLWRCKYRTASTGTYKWHVIDAPPLIVESLTNVTITQTSPTTFGAATPGGPTPTITLPFNGDWDITTYAGSPYKFGAAGYLYMAPNIAGAGTNFTDGIVTYSSAGAEVSGGRQNTRRKAVAGTRVIAMHAWVNTGSGYTSNNSDYYGFRCRPVRLG